MQAHCKKDPEQRQGWALVSGACEVGAEKRAKIRLCLGPDVASRPPREGASLDPSEGGSAPRPLRHKGALGGLGGAVFRARLRRWEALAALGGPSGGSSSAGSPES